MNIVLIGFMASGKSSVAKILTEQLNWQVKDTDHLIEALEGTSIAEIFQHKGESYFRQLETNVLKQLSEESGVIISTGGGIVEKAENRPLLQNNNFVVYLETNVETVLKYTQKDQTRPLLDVEDKKGEIEKRLQRRTPIYESICHLKLPAHQMKLSEIATGVVANMKTIFPG